MEFKTPPMSGNYIREWRDFYDLTQDGLAVRIGTNASVISQLETGGRRSHSGWIARLAMVFCISRGMIYDKKPDDLPEEDLDILKARFAEMEKIRRIMKTMNLGSNVTAITPPRHRPDKDKTKNDVDETEEGGQG